MDIEEAKKLLRASGYSVIPDWRLGTLTVNRSVSWLVLEQMKGAEEAKRFTEHMDANAAREIGYEMQRQGLIQKTDMGYGVACHNTKYEAAIIRPF